VYVKSVAVLFDPLELEEEVDLLLLFDPLLRSIRPPPKRLAVVLPVVLPEVLGLVPIMYTAVCVSSAPPSNVVLPQANEVQATNEPSKAPLIIRL
jgi:hypothetical protein